MKLIKKYLLLLFILGGLWFFWGVIKTPVEEKRMETVQENPIKIAIFSDIHSDFKNLYKALKIAKRDNSDFLIITGDLTTLGKISELNEIKELLDNSGLEYYVLPGNHDLWWDKKFKEDNFGEVFGKDYQSFNKNKVKFILVNNGDVDLGLGEAQEKWFREEIKECLRVYCLVFTHIPLNHPKSLYVMGADNRSVASEAGKLIKLLVENRVKELFAGHLHLSSSYFLDGLQTTIVGAIASERNFQSPKFLEVKYLNGELEKKEIFLSN